MDNKKVVALALQSKEFKENNLTNVKLAVLAGFNTEEIEFVKLFWGPAFNESWIYVTKNMVVEWFGYKDSKDTMSDFYKKLNKDYEKDIDFKEVDQNDEILCNRDKYYGITGDCLKTLLITSQTLPRKVVRKIYLKTEKLVTIMREVINQQSLMIKDLKIEEQQKLVENQQKLAEKRQKQSKSKEHTLKSEIKNLETFKPNGWIYLTTTKQYSINNVFRLGKTVNLDKRMQNYTMGRSKNDRLYYVFVFRSANIELLELILRRLLNKYKEDATENRDIFILPFHLLKPFVENVCNLFNNNIIKSANEMIESNIDFIDTSSTVGPEIPPFLFSRSKEETDVDLFEPNVTYYEQILVLYSEYSGFEVLTEKSQINTMFDAVDIKCPHSRRQIQVRTILNGIGCNHCVKNKTLLEKETMLLTSTVDFSDYTIIDLIDETTPEFIARKTMDKNRKITQNIIIIKYATENIKLITEYQNFDKKISSVCSFGHTCTTSYNALKKLQAEFCRTCRDLKREIATAAIKTQVTEEELVKQAELLGWKHIRKTGKEGLIEWLCPNNHMVTKVLRELKRGFCDKC